MHPNWSYNCVMHHNNALSELYCPYMIFVDTRVPFRCLIVSKITRITLKMSAIFCVKWPPKWRIQWTIVFGNTFSGIYAPQNLYIDSTLKALCVLVSELDARRITLEMDAIL